MGSSSSTQIAETEAQVQAHFDEQHATGVYSKKGVLQPKLGADEYGFSYQGRACGICQLTLLFPHLLVLVGKPKPGNEGDGQGSHPTAPPKVIHIIFLEDGVLPVLRNCELLPARGTSSDPGFMITCAWDLETTITVVEGKDVDVKRAKAASWVEKICSVRQQFITTERDRFHEESQNCLSDFSDNNNDSDGRWIESESGQLEFVQGNGIYDTTEGVSDLKDGANDDDAAVHSVTADKPTGELSSSTFGKWDREGPLIFYAGKKNSKYSYNCYAELVDDIFIWYRGDVRKEEPRKVKSVDLVGLDYVTNELIHTSQNMAFMCCGARGAGFGPSYDVKAKEEMSGKPSGFTIYSTSPSTGQQRIHSFCTKSHEEAEAWIRNIFHAVPFNIPTNILSANSIGSSSSTSSRSSMRDISSVACDKFVNEARNGDVLLFRGKARHCKMLRAVTRAKYDHVGLVVRGPNGTPFLLDATGDGVCLHKFSKFIRKGWYKPYQYVAWRRLIFRDGEKELDKMPEQLQKKLHDFVEMVIGMNYRITISSLRTKKNQDHDERKGFFCSELVAAVLQQIGVLGPDPAAGQYWPGTFANDTKHRLKMNKSIEAMSSTSLNNGGPEFRLDSTERIIDWNDGALQRQGKTTRGCMG